LDTTPPTPASPSFPPNAEAYALRLVAEGFDDPLFLTHAGDGSGRSFVVEQSGRIHILQDGAILPQAFLDLTGIAVNNAFERGLLGLAFHPRYAENGQFFVNYTDPNGDTAVVRYAVSAEDSNRADPQSAQIVLQVEQPYSNHNGGGIAFGPDGYLYIGMGDGGSAGDPQGNGQSLTTLLGKMLRLDGGEPYAIPPDNPFAGRSPARPEIWAYGLRNPWRFSFDRATGDLYIADVGQNAYEEVNFQPADSAGGENYGWDVMEGLHPFEGQLSDALTMPVAEYAQSEGGCSITGGYVYRGEALPELQGVYFFGDYCSGLIWTLHRTADGAWERALFMSTGLNISSFGEDEAGELYVVDHGGAVYQLTAAP
jgi:glucose/arabinose dehydrogenase